MEPRLPAAARRASEGCAFCSGGKDEGSLTALGLEPTSLERERPHAPDCPLLPTRRPRKSMLPLFAFAVLPVVGLRTCANDPDAHQKFGLDDGTVSTPAVGSEEGQSRTG